MVSDDAASRDVWLGENGALAGARPGPHLIESSTSDREVDDRTARRQRRIRKCEFLDAPVTGSKPQAAAGELLFLVGGSAGALERCGRFLP